MNKTSISFATLSTLINEGDTDAIHNYLVGHNGSPNKSDEDGDTLLMVASMCGNLAIVNELVSQGADVNAEDVDNWTALLAAAEAGHADIVVKLLDHGARIDHRDAGGWTPLMWASYKGHAETVSKLLEYGAAVNVHDKNHCTCLIWAAGRGYFEIVDKLLHYGAKVNSGDKYGTTPLVWACRKGYREIVEILLEAGANVDTAGMFSWTALLVATKGNYSGIVNMLLEHKPNVNAVGMDKCTALSLACKGGFTEVAVALMNNGAYINLQDRNGDTNLIHATKAGHFAIVDALLKKYADVDIQGSDGKTALYWAAEKGYPEIARIILNAKPNTEYANKDGDNPLIRATRNRHTDIVQMLVDKKAKVSAADKIGDTALHVAMRARSKAIVEILLRNPKNSQLLYRPNRAGETPYNIDANHSTSILAQIFGARRLNTNEDSENRLGYELYSSALADILSAPSLSMPISVGLYAKWGSGKSFLLNKLEDEMRNFSSQWLEPVFEFSWLVFILVLLVSVTAGVIISLSWQKWIIGVSVGGGIFVLTFILLGVVVQGNQNYDWTWVYNISVVLASQLHSLRTLLFVLFCNPPACRRDIHTDPVRFLFTNQTKVNSSGGDVSVGQIVISLHIAIEEAYGFITTRLYRVFRPKPVPLQRWKWRCLCCVPYCLIALLVYGIILGGATLLVLSGAATDNPQDSSNQEVTRGILIAMACLVGVVFISNLYTWVHLVAALVIPHQKRIQHNLSQIESTQATSYLQSLKNEIDTIVSMVQCLDAFVCQQTRLVVIVDGLDSCEQEKVLRILDAVHLLFSDPNAPFVTVLAIDPHIVTAAIESNIHRVFHNSPINGHEYLRNIVHLPFYLQNTGLRRVKTAQQAASAWAKRPVNHWNEDREYDRSVAATASSRKASNSSMSIPDAMRKRPKGNHKLKSSESMASSISNLHRMVTGAQDLNKVLLTDDYFSDVNPRSMRRLMNIVYITGRLLKAFQIDFNWYHLASWINITEQWPYRTSWIIMYYEMHENEFDETMSLKTVYEKIKSYMPVSKEKEPTLDLDHDERKFEVFLSFHSSSLLINDLKVFLPFTINLDPYIRKIIQETHQQVAEFLKNDLKPSVSHPPQPDVSMRWPQAQLQPGLQNVTSPSDTSHLYVNYKMPVVQSSSQPGYVMSIPPVIPSSYSGSSSPMWWNYQPEPLSSFQLAPPKRHLMTLPKNCKKLSTLSVEGVASMLSSLERIDKQKLKQYVATLKENNINGQVLLSCDLKDLKDVLQMSFGDWELFRLLILELRDYEFVGVNVSESSEDSHGKNSLPVSGKQVTAPLKSPSGTESPDRRSRENSITVLKTSSENSGTHSRRGSSILEKQVTMEESMIVGALETLNEEALEDAMEEKLLSREASGMPGPSNPLSPIISDPEEPIFDEHPDVRQIANTVINSFAFPTEIDVLYLKGSRDSPSFHVSAMSLSDSVTDVESSSTGKVHQCPTGFENAVAGPSALIVNDGISTPRSVTSSPVSRDSSRKGASQRPSSLVYDSSEHSNSVKSTPVSDNPVVKFKPIPGPDKTKTAVTFAVNNSKTKRVKKRSSVNKDMSSYSSSDTDETPVLETKAVPQRIASPQDDADGFYSDDEHTPLVSPFHATRPSHYNLQAAQKSEKESTPEKSIPKQSQSENGHTKKRKPLERQFSIDSNLSNYSKSPPLSTSMVNIPTPPSPTQHHHLPPHRSFIQSHLLPVYGQHVSDAISPEQQTPTESDFPLLQTETIL